MENIQSLDELIQALQAVKSKAGRGDLQVTVVVHGDEQLCGCRVKKLSSTVELLGYKLINAAPIVELTVF